MKKSRTKSKESHPPANQRSVAVQLSIPLLAEVYTVPLPNWTAVSVKAAARKGGTVDVKVRA